MAAETFISWCQSTMNFWVGCEKVSEACTFCYAQAWAKRAGVPELWEGQRRRTKTWREPMKWHRGATAFFAKHGVRQRVFTNSLADFFDNAVEDQWREDAWKVIEETPSLEWLIVTKRVSNISKMLPANFSGLWFKHCIFIITVVTQAEADRDIPRLIDIKKKYPWLRIGLSMEPLLEFIDLKWEWLEWLNWVIVGGESGGRARPMNAAWVLAIRDKCIAAGVHFHFKQWGEWLTFDAGYPGLMRALYGVGVIGARIDGVRYPSKDIHRFEDGSYAIRVGINRTGRLLEGVLHNDFARDNV